MELGFTADDFISRAWYTASRHCSCVDQAWDLFLYFDVVMVGSTCSILPQGFLTLIKHNFHRKQYFLESIRNLVTNSYKLCIELLFGYFKQIFILM